MVIRSLELSEFCVNLHKNSLRMSPKIKDLVSTKKVRHLKRVVILGAGDIPSGTTVKTYVPRGDSGKDIVKFRKGLYQVRVIGQTDDSHTVKDSVQERDVVYVLELADKMQRSLRDIRNESRRESRTNGGGGGGGGTPPTRIFHRLVDEDKMSDCILHIKDSYFHAEKECDICEKNCTIYDFFMLVHYYFCYIGIMSEDISQLAFCTYLNKRVFGGNDIVNVRSFNNYTQKDKYKSFAKLLSENKDIRFDNRPQLPRPNTESFLLAPFQEIGWKFQHSSYFKELKAEQERVQNFVL